MPRTAAGHTTLLRRADFVFCPLDLEWSRRTFKFESILAALEMAAKSRLTEADRGLRARATGYDTKQGLRVEE